MASLEARCLNFVSPECVRRREGGRKKKAQVINFSCSLKRLCKLKAMRLPPRTERSEIYREEKLQKWMKDGKNI